MRYHDDVDIPGPDLGVLEPHDLDLFDESLHRHARVLGSEVPYLPGYISEYRTGVCSDTEVLVKALNFVLLSMSADNC
jgi:hypothetical protein